MQHVHVVGEHVAGGRTRRACGFRSLFLAAAAGAVFWMVLPLSVATWSAGAPVVAGAAGVAMAVVGSVTRGHSARHAGDLADLHRTMRSLRLAEERLRTAVEAADVVTWDHDIATGRVVVSENFERLFGLEPGAFPGTYEAFRAMVHPDDRELVTPEMADRSGVFDQDFRILRADGTIRWLHAHGRLLRDETGAPARVVGASVDLTEQREVNGSLATRAAQQAVVAELGRAALGSPDLSPLFHKAASDLAGALKVEHSEILVLVDDGDAFEVSARVGSHREVGDRFPVGIWYGSQAAYTLSSGRIVMVDYADEGRFRPERELVAQGVRSGLSVVIGDADRRVGVLTVHTTRLRAFSDDDVNFVQAVAHVLASAVERDRTEAAVRHRARHDRLTELPNRSHLVELLESHPAGASGTQDPGLALILADLDHFKDVNESLGHALGDRVLQEVAALLRLWVNADDVVARIEGDQFAVLTRSVAGPADAKAAAGVLASLLDTVVSIDGLTVSIAASVGVSWTPGWRADTATLLHEAELAMRRAKRERSGVAVFDGEDRQDRLTKLALAADLKAAIEGQAIEVAYQPQVDLESGAVRLVEALARWTHPDLGPIGPSVFVPLAEHAGLIRPLTRHMLRRSLDQVRTWGSEGIDLGVAVNVSAHTLLDPELEGWVVDALRAAGVDAGRLTLEVTESAFTADSPRVTEVLDRLRALGVRLSIDDFGTGYSALSYLKRLPVDEVKIDRAFVMNVADDHRDAAIVRAIVQLAHSLGLTVVAEGLESERAVEYLRVLDCDTAQGYWFTEPLEAAGLTAWLAQWTARERVAS